MKAYLALEDGTIFEGTAFGAAGERTGEVVFNTSMTGYQEILTDPSYKGQIVTMTYPLIGNYGINNWDVESFNPKVEGFIVREVSAVASSYRSRLTLDEYLKRNGVIGLAGIDTRALTKHIRTQGAMKGIISTEHRDKQDLVRWAKESPGLIGRDLVKEVTCQKIHRWDEEGKESIAWRTGDQHTELPPLQFKVAAMDFGIKKNILRILRQSGCDVTVFPAGATAQEILAACPQGLFLSNGPGDPEGVGYAIETVRSLIGKLPIFGICLGHQLLGLALGGKTFKLKFGHRGANQPVMELASGKVEITSQNHGFAVDPKSLNPEEVELTHINLNDQTSEGMCHKKLPVFSVQYHPESSPGPHDSRYLFKRFTGMMSGAGHA